MFWGNHGFMGGFMWVFWIAVLVGLVFLVVWLVKQSRPEKNESKEDPVEILKKRYARGEIDREEFEQKKRDLLG